MLETTAVVSTLIGDVRGPSSPFVVLRKLISQGGATHSRQKKSETTTHISA
jgi:ABC-type Mn2+/Zn2+ transport system permease subunit